MGAWLHLDGVFPWAHGCTLTVCLPLPSGAWPAFEAVLSEYAVGAYVGYLGMGNRCRHRSPTSLGPFGKSGKLNVHGWWLGLFFLRLQTASALRACVQWDLLFLVNRMLFAPISRKAAVTMMSFDTLQRGDPKVGMDEFYVIFPSQKPFCQVVDNLNS